MFGGLSPEEKDQAEAGRAGHGKNRSRATKSARECRYGCSVKFRAADIANIVGGTLVGSDVDVDGAAIDSRVIQSGQLFVPVRGERDGHDFIENAKNLGAAATLSSLGATDGIPTIVVDDAEAAFARLGAAARLRLPDRLAGVTGSVGKTSTKDLAVAILARRYVVTANEKSFNNELGVPLTLVNASADTEVSIIEMGARGDGHISDLCSIARPTVAIVTAIELAHSEFMGGLADIARAKGELVEALPTDGLAILNADDERVAAMASRTSARALLFGIERGDVRASNIRLDEELRAHFDLQSDRGSAPVVLAVRGRHHVVNALAAATLAIAWGVPLDDIVGGLAEAQLSPWRMELHVAPSGVRVLNDAYNAGPASMEAALRALAHLPASEHVAVLGPMAELGNEGPQAHVQVAALARELGIKVIAIGTSEYGSLPVASVDSIDDAIAQLNELGVLNARGAVLVKGSRIAGLERVAQRLLERT